MVFLYSIIDGDGDSDGDGDGDDDVNFPSKSLRYTYLLLLKNADCVSSPFNKSHVYAGYKKDRNNSYTSDPGGPLIVPINNLPVIYGWFFL